MQAIKNHCESSQNSLILEYPFLMSSIKKIQSRQSEARIQIQPGNKINFQQAFPGTRSLTPQHLLKKADSPECDINDDSSIEFCEEQEVDEATEREIEELEQQITYKLSEQYNLLKQKLKLKSQQRQNVLRTFRQISIIQPLYQKTFQNNNQAKNITPNSQQKKSKHKHLHTKTIKNRIIRKIEQSQNLPPLKTFHSITVDDQPYNNEYSQSQRNAFNYAFKLKILSPKNQQTPELLKTIKHREVRSITKIDNPDEVIRQMSEEIKQIEFRKLENIANGKFTFLRKK